MKKSVMMFSAIAMIFSVTVLAAERVPAAVEKHPASQHHTGDKKTEPQKRKALKTPHHSGKKIPLSQSKG
ncbi:hypothetical protein ACQYRI_10660 [Salmonella enterica]